LPLRLCMKKKYRASCGQIVKQTFLARSRMSISSALFPQRSFEVHTNPRHMQPPSHRCARHASRRGLCRRYQSLSVKRPKSLLTGARLLRPTSLTLCVRAKATVLLLWILTAASAWAQTATTNASLILTATELRDRLYDAGAGSALVQYPVHAAVL